MKNLKMSASRRLIPSGRKTGGTSSTQRAHGSLCQAQKTNLTLQQRGYYSDIVGKNSLDAEAVCSLAREIGLIFQAVSLSASGVPSLKAWSRVF